MDDATSTNILVRPPPSSSIPRNTSVHDLYRQHYCVIVLMATTVLVPMTLSLTSIQTAVFAVPVLVIYIHTAMNIIKRHNSLTVPTPFLIMQAARGAFIAPFKEAFYAIPAILFYVSTFFIGTLFIMNKFHIVHSGEPWDFFAAHGATLVLFVTSAMSITGKSPLPFKSSNTYFTFANKDASEAFVTLPELISHIRNTLVKRGVSRGYIVLFIFMMFIFFIKTMKDFLLTWNQKREEIKLSLMKHYVKALSSENQDPELAVALLGTSGIVTVGCTAV